MPANEAARVCESNESTYYGPHESPQSTSGECPLAARNSASALVGHFSVREIGFFTFGLVTFFGVDRRRSEGLRDRTVRSSLTQWSRSIG